MRRGPGEEEAGQEGERVCGLFGRRQKSSKEDLEKRDDDDIVDMRNPHT